MGGNEDAAASLFSCRVLKDTPTTRSTVGEEETLLVVLRLDQNYLDKRKTRKVDNSESKGARKELLLIQLFFYGSRA